MSDLMLNRTIKQFRIDAVLGQGGMGTVYRATDMNLGRLVALKVMHPNFAIQPEFEQRFRQEAQSAARLDHPNIIRIFEFDLDPTQRILYMVTELVPGGSLRDYIKKLYGEKKYVPQEEALALCRQVAYALDYAHQQGLFHRDVKPDNVLLKPGSGSGDETMNFRAILTDFGLAKLAEGGVQSIANNPTGTLPYMSPEQANADPIDGRTDIYALGIMLYELLTGRLPFLPRTIPEAIKMHSQVPPEPPTQARPSLPAAADALILRALVKNPRERYQTASEFARAISEFEKSLGRGGSAAKAEPPPDSGESIGTYIQNSMANANRGATPNLPQLPANQSGVDQLVVMADGQAAQLIPINKPVLNIGRDPGGDVVLNSPTASRVHARIERRPDGLYTITHLSSTNKTFLGEAEIVSNVPEVWHPEKMVRIGGYTLGLQRAAISYQTGVAVQAATPSLAPPGMMGTIAGAGAAAAAGVMGVPGGIELKLSMQNYAIEAGGRIDIQMNIRNMSELVEHYTFVIEGIPKEWYSIPMTTLQLMPAREGENVSRGMASVAFHPPRNCKSTAATHIVTIRVNSQARGKEVGRATFNLTINPYYEYKADIQPKRIRNAGNARILVKNLANAPDSYTLTPRDREEALHFDPPMQSVSANACSDQGAVFFVRGQHRPLFGRGQKVFQYEVEIAAAGSSFVQTLNAEVAITPRIPWWVLLLPLFLCLLCFLLVFLLRCSVLGAIPSLAPQYAQFCPAPQGLPAFTVTAQQGTLSGWLTATANSFQLRQTATFDSRFKTATSNAGATQTVSADQKAAATAAAATKGAIATSTAQAAKQATDQASLIQTIQAGQRTP